MTTSRASHTRRLSFIFLAFLPFLGGGGELNVLSGVRAALFEALQSSFFSEGPTLTVLRERYEGEGLTVLLVPGHDLKSPGAAFGEVTEEAMNRLMASYLAERLGVDPHIKLLLTRDLTTGEYTQGFARYLTHEESAIKKFRETQRSITEFAFSAGFLPRELLVHHNSADERVSTVLYGVNRYANKHDVDVVIHVHFNDHAGRRVGRVGKYSGFAIYVPHSIFVNSGTSNALAQKIYQRLTERFPSSDLPQEGEGIIPDQELIAVGANGSLTKTALLIEYGYIYESQFGTRAVRNAVLREMAYQSYLGLKDAFEHTPLSRAESTTLLPYHWQRDLAKGRGSSLDTLSLQAALNALGHYPPVGKTLSDCPLNGSYGACVSEAVRAYQREVDLPPVGTVGPATRKLLNEHFNS